MSTSLNPPRAQDGLKSPAQVCPLCGGTGFRPVPGENHVERCDHAQRGQPERAERVEGSFESRATIDLLLRTGCSRAGLPLSKDELALCCALGTAALGQRNAVPLDDLCQCLLWKLTDSNKRAIKGLVERLRSVHWLDIGACRASRPELTRRGEQVLAGYYWITSTEEFLDTWGPYYRQCITGLRHYYQAARRHGGLHKLMVQRFGQLPLFEPPGETLTAADKENQP